MVCANVLISWTNIPVTLLEEHLFITWEKLARTFKFWEHSMLAGWAMLSVDMMSKSLLFCKTFQYCILKEMANHQSKHQNSIEEHRAQMYTHENCFLLLVVVSLSLLPDKAVPIKPCWMVNTFGSGYKAQNILQCQCQCSLNRLVQTELGLQEWDQFLFFIKMLILIKRNMLHI